MTVHTARSTLQVTDGDLSVNAALVLVELRAERLVERSRCFVESRDGAAVLLSSGAHSTAEALTGTTNSYFYVSAHRWDCWLRDG